MDHTAREMSSYTAEEFYRIVETIPGRSELRRGEIASLVSPSRQHQHIAYRMHHVIEAYIRTHNGSCEVDGEIDVELDDKNVVVPDLAVICDLSKLNEHGCKGAPDWVIEILSTNRRDDLVLKLDLYHLAGVREYWIVDPKNEKTLVYFFERNDLPDIYTFDTLIPVEIYDRQLSIRIAELI